MLGAVGQKIRTFAFGKQLTLAAIHKCSKFLPGEDAFMSYIQKQLDWQDTADRNYIVRHWLGHLPLPISYWVNGVVVPFAFAFGVQAALTQLARTEIALHWLMALDLLYLVFSAALWLWSIVGIWRSAGYHEERGGSAGWANAARAMVVIGALGQFLQSHDRFLYLAEEANLAFGTDPLGDPAQFTVQRGGKNALLDGNITEGTAERFKSFMEAHPEITDVNLRSKGGRTFEADRIAKFINQHGLNTAAQEYCMSACTLVLLAGKERAATADAKVGFHQPQFPGLSGAEQATLVSDMRQMYIKAGVTPEFLDQALSVPPENMWFPTVDQLLSAKVITTSPIVVKARSKLEKEMRGNALQEYLNYTAGQINSAGPFKLDKLTTRTGARATTNVLTIRYRLDVQASQIDAAFAKRHLAPVLTKQVCDDQKTNLAVYDGATFVFSYYDRNGNAAFSIPVSKCGGG